MQSYMFQEHRVQEAFRRGDPEATRSMSIPVLEADTDFGRWLRRLGKALVAEPTVTATDDADNEYGRCKVCRGNCFRGSSQDLCQVCLRCNVDYQYQIRTFPQQEISKEATSDGASEHTSVHPPGQKQAQTLPSILG